MTAILIAVMNEEYSYQKVLCVILFT